MKRVILTGLAAFATGCLTCAGRLMRPATAVAVTAIFLSMFSPLSAAPPDIARVAGDLPRSLDLQTELPLRDPVDPSSANSRSFYGSDTNFVFWIVVIIGAGVLAYCMYEILPAVGGRRAQWDQLGGDGGNGPAGRGSDDPVRAAADELAQQGRFVEAMHVLLLQGLDEMRMRLDLRFADSLTSREIVSRANAPAGAKTALRDMIAWVERAYFGDHPVDRSDYDACRRSYVALDGILRAGSPA
jgi:hypothetical protein